MEQPQLSLISQERYYSFPTTSMTLFWTLSQWSMNLPCAGTPVMDAALQGGSHQAEQRSRTISLTCCPWCFWAVSAHCQLMSNFSPTSTPSTSWHGSSQSFHSSACGRWPPSGSSNLKKSTQPFPYQHKGCLPSWDHKAEVLTGQNLIYFGLAVSVHSMKVCPLSPKAIPWELWKYDWKFAERWHFFLVLWWSFWAPYKWCIITDQSNCITVEHHKITSCYLSNQAISADTSLLATGLFSFKEDRRNSVKSRKFHHLDIVQISSQTDYRLLNNKKIYLDRTHWKSQEKFLEH